MHIYQFVTDMTARLQAVAQFDGHTMMQEPRKFLKCRFLSIMIKARFAQT